MNRPYQTPISVTDRFTNLGRFFWILGLVIAIAAFCQLPAFAQFASGSIGATVADTTGAVIPHAKVVLKNEATGALRDSVTDNAGYFDFPSILPASYTLTVTAPGLTTYEQTGITLNQGATLRLSTIVLRVQSTKEEVVVVAGGDVQVPTDSGTSSQTLNKSMVEDISLNGRDAAELIKIMPGTAINNGLTQSQFGQGAVPTIPARSASTRFKAAA